LGYDTPFSLEEYAKHAKKVMNIGKGRIGPGLCTNHQVRMAKRILAL
jgi:hypothetical protein